MNTTNPKMPRLNIDQIPLNKLHWKRFEQLCRSILQLLDPIKIIRLGPGGDGGRDLEVRLPPLEAGGAEREEWWWIECKRKNSVGISDIGKNAYQLLAKHNAPPPDVLFYFTSTHLSSDAIDSILGVSGKLPFAIRYLDGHDIRSILLAHPDLIEEYFPEVLQHYDVETLRSSESKSSVRQIFVNAYRDFNCVGDALLLSPGRPVTLEVKLRNLTASDWRRVPISVELPPGAKILGPIQECVDLAPYEGKSITFRFVTNTYDKNKLYPPKIKIDNNNHDCNIHYSYTTIDFRFALVMPFIGRDQELSQLKDGILDGAGLILIEGLAGEGKSRLLNEAKTICDKPESIWHEVGSKLFSNSDALFRAIGLGLLNIRHLEKSTELFSAVLRAGRTGINDDLLERTLSGQHKPTKGDIKTLIRMLDERVAPNQNVRPIFALDDLHYISLQALEVLEQFIKVFGGRALFVVAYRENEIDPYVRDRLLQLYQVYIVLNPLTNETARLILNEISNLPNTLADDLVMHSQGNPFCLSEALRLLVEDGTMEFGSDGLLREKNPELTSLLVWPEQHKINIEAYAHQLALKRFNAAVKSAGKDGREVERIGSFLAILAEPAPLSLMKAVFGDNRLILLDRLIDEQLLAVEHGSFSNELGITLIHDRAAEAISANIQLKPLQWAELNSQIATALAKHIDRQQLPEYYSKIALHWSQSGNGLAELEYRQLDFWCAVELHKNSTIESVGLRCLDLLERFAARSHTQGAAPARISFQIGLSQYHQRRFDAMDKSFSLAETMAPVDGRKQYLMKIYRLSASMLRSPERAADFESELIKTVGFLDELERNGESDIELIDALLHGMNTLFIHLKKFHAAYDQALEINRHATALCEKHHRPGMMIWEEINSGTLILFRDEVYRNQLDFSKMRPCWEQALAHWEQVLDKAESSRNVEHVIETNCAVGFMKMFLGVKDNQLSHIEEAALHFRRSFHYAEKFDHPYWCCKLHNHLGIHHLLAGNSDAGNEELGKGMMVTRRLDNTYTEWMLQQNLANASMINGAIDDARRYWKNGLQAALVRHFGQVALAMHNYNFRLFLRGLLLHIKLAPDLIGLIREYPELTKAVQADLGLSCLEAALKNDSAFKELERGDLYVHKKCYFNTH